MYKLDLRMLFVSSIGIKILSAALLLSISVVLAKWLGPSDFGVYSLLLSTAAVLGIPISSGLPALLTRELALFAKTNERSHIKAILIFASVVVMVVAVFLGGGLWVGSGWAKENTTLNFEYFFYVLLLMLLLSLDRLRGAVMQGFGSALISQVPENIVRPFIMLVAAALGYLWFVGDVLQFAIFSYGVSVLCSFLIGGALVRSRLRAFPLKRVIPIYKTRYWVVSLFSLGALSSTQTLIGNADIIILGWLGGSADVGIYKVAMQGVALLLVAQTGITTVLATSFSQAFAREDLPRVIAVSDSSVKMFAFISLIAMMVIYLLADYFVIFLFGVDYIVAAEVLMVLAAGQVVNALTGPALTVLIMGRKEKAALLSVGAGGVVMVAFAYLLVPEYQAVGMAVASASGGGVTNLLLAFSVKRKMGFDPSIVGAVYREHLKRGR